MGIDKKSGPEGGEVSSSKGWDGVTVWKIETIVGLSPLAKERTQALKTYSHLEGKVVVDNTGITVKTSKGDLKFAFSHIEWGQTFKEAKSPYSKEQFEALIEVFWNAPAPYIDILGMKNTHIGDDNKIHNYNFYWSSSEDSELKINAWGLKLTQDKVTIEYDVKDNNFSAITSSN